jgi:hypothetical protein
LLDGGDKVAVARQVFGVGEASPATRRLFDLQPGDDIEVVADLACSTASSRA